ncbi:MAG: helix-turn-helix transcriptional regulator [Acidimicrobiales bacterium]
MIDLAVLGLLKDHDLHGYELRKRLGDLPGWRPAVSFGSLYPALARLERAGLVKAVTNLTSPAPPTPMSGSLTGELAAFRLHRRSSTAKESRGSRGKKVYGITEAGRDRLHELLAAPEVVDDREFAVRLAFCHHLSPAERLALFVARRDELARRRDEQRQDARTSEPRLTSYLRSLLERDTEATTADLAWIERLIDAERSAVEPAGEAAEHTPGG